MLTLRIAARELQSLLRTPIAYVVAIAFLVVQGLSFTAVVTELSDPSRPAPLGAVLEGHFGGSVLHWTLQIAIVSLLAMRTIAEGRRSGTWEVLLTAPVGEGAAVVGAWLGALAFYALLWIPTLAYLAVISIYAPAGAHFDPGPIASAYLGELVVGASFLAVGVAASAATSNQIVAGVASFATLLVLLMLGELAAPGGTAWHAVAVREHLAAFARGEVPLAAIVMHAGLAITALSLAGALARAGRRRDVGARLLATGLVGIIATLGALLAVRHPRTLDVTAERVHTLDRETRAVLDRVDTPIELAILRPTMPTFDPLYEVVERTAARMSDAQPLITVRRIDPATDPDGAAALAQEAGTATPLVDRGGAVLVTRGTRRHVVLLTDLADYGRDPLKAPTITKLRAEEGLTAAIAEVGDDRPATVCVTSGHGELAIAARPDARDASRTVERLRRDGIHVEDVAGEVPASCTAVAVLGPTEPLPRAEVAAIADHVARGGGLLVAASSEGTLPPTGLEPILGSLGLDAPAAIAIDPPSMLGQVPLAFRVVDGYGDHPSVRGFAEWRPTVWQRARPVTVAPLAGVTQVPLVIASPRSFATRDVAGAAAVTQPTDPDLLGPVRLAVRAQGPGGAVVLIGSAESLSSIPLQAGIGAGDVLLAALLADLAGRTRPDLSLPDRTPSQVRLSMTAGERNAVFVLCVIVLPLGFAAIGTAAALWRRRRRM